MPPFPGKPPHDIDGIVCYFQLLGNNPLQNLKINPFSIHSYFIPKPSILSASPFKLAQLSLNIIENVHGAVFQDATITR